MAVGSQSACPSSTMDVLLQGRREVVVDDVGQTPDVQTPGSYIRSYHHLGFATAEILHSLLKVRCCFKSIENFIESFQRQSGVCLGRRYFKVHGDRLSAAYDAFRVL